MDAAWRARRRGRGTRARRRPRCRDEPLLFKIEISPRLGGELGWSGVNTGVISSRAPTPPTRKPVRERAASGKSDHGFETRAIHAGAMPDASTGARITPIYQTSSYVFEERRARRVAVQFAQFRPCRLSNPTVAVLEERIAALEGGRAAVAAASGHAAQFLTFFTLLEPGDEFIASRNLYGGSLTQFGASFRKLGWTCHFVDQKDPENFKRALTGRAKAIFIEVSPIPAAWWPISRPSRASPRAPAFRSSSTIRWRRPISAARSNGAPTRLSLDDEIPRRARQFAGRCGGGVGQVRLRGQRQIPVARGPEPAYHGIDFFETFGDFAFTMKARAVALRDLGPTLAPMNAFLTIMGVETLPLRMERHVANAARVAEFLESHPRVAWVSYAGLESSPYRDLAKKYLPRGAGAVSPSGSRAAIRPGSNSWSWCDCFRISPMSATPAA